ncbi:MAG: transcriptional regulator, partial [Actinomycetia bacterium]|nr:transcriptional regulator [Actinomycetes bacterium]
RRAAAAPAPAAAPPRDRGNVRSRRDLVRRRKRRRFWFLWLPASLVVVALIVGAGVLVRDGRKHSSSPAPKAGALAGAPTPTVVIGHRASDGTVDLLMVAGANRGVRQGSVLFIPTTLQVQAPSLGVQSLRDIVRLGDVGLLRASVQNVLGVAMPDIVLLDDAGWTSAFATSKSLTLDVRSPIRTADGSVNLAVGRQVVSGPDAARIISIAPASHKESDRIAAGQAVMEAWAPTLTDPAHAQAVATAQPAISPFLALTRAKLTIDTLVTKPTGSGDAQKDQPVPAETLSTVKSDFPDSRLVPDGDRTTIQILNGTGAVGVVKTPAECAVPAGFDVRLTGNLPGFGQAATLVLYHDDRMRTEADRLAATLATVKVEKSTRDLGVVDLAMVVGTDFTGCAPAREGTSSTPAKSTPASTR